MMKNTYIMAQGLDSNREGKPVYIYFWAIKLGLDIFSRFGF